MLPDALWQWALTVGGSAGPFFLLGWWLERRERQDVQKRNDILVDRLAKVSEDAAVAVKGLRDLLMRAAKIDRDDLQ